MVELSTAALVVFAISIGGVCFVLGMAVGVILLVTIVSKMTATTNKMKGEQK